jgi:hypothetical protein
MKDEENAKHFFSSLILHPSSFDSFSLTLLEHGFTVALLSADDEKLVTETAKREFPLESKLMKRLSRILPAVALAGSLVGSSAVIAQEKPPAGNAATPATPTAPAATPAPAPGTAAATDATATPAPGAAAAASAAPAPPTATVPEAPVKSEVEDFWHYAKIARYDLAAAEANRILEHANEPAAVRDAFVGVSTERKDNLDQWLLRWQNVPALHDPVTKIITVLNEGYQAQRADPAAIEQNIQRLTTNERAYQLGIQRLRQSGELAVPMLIDYLKDPDKAKYHAVARRALTDLGRAALNPLVATTEMKDSAALTEVAGILGDVGYDVSVPYLAKLANDPKQSPSVKSAAMASLLKMGAGDPASLNAAQLFNQLAEKFYYDNAAISADPRLPTAAMWYWDESKGLYKKDVPTPIFNELMAMRACEYGIKLNPNNAEAVSLWLASNYKREAELPEGQTDPTREAGQPSAHYYGVEAGVQYLNAALTRTVKDRNAAVSYKIIKSLQEIVGVSNLFGEQGTPLVEAMSFPDRQVRFEAAMTLAAALPTKPFTGSERVVPLLAEALAQNGKPGVLVVATSQDQANAIVDAFKKDGYAAAGATSADSAAVIANTLPAVDVIIEFEDLGAGQIDQLQALSSGSPRLERSSKLIVTHTAGSPYAEKAASDPLLSTTQSADPAELKKSVEAARKKGSSIPLDEKVATEYALRASNLLLLLGESHNPILDTTPAMNTLLTSLDDPRAELVKSAGNAVALINSSQAQQGLLIKASDDKTPDDLRISLYKSLATAAKFYGNQLAPDQVEQLQKTVELAPNLDVRSAAAEAMGALNLPATRARVLIVNQSKT